MLIILPSCPQAVPNQPHIHSKNIGKKSPRVSEVQFPLGHETTILSELKGNCGGPRASLCGTGWERAFSLRDRGH